MAYLINTPEDQRVMLTRIGVGSIDELFSAIPPEVRRHAPLDVPPGLTEMELTAHVEGLAARNRGADRCICFLGAGSYDHFIPAVVDVLASRSEFYTAYTPYQAEASQGSLQAFFEYQTLVCQLTGMEVANASLYEGASAVAEAALMAIAVTGRHGRVLVAETVHPHYRQVLATYMAHLEARPQVVPARRGALDPDEVRSLIGEDTACLIVQHPNFFGCLEEVEALCEAAHERGALFVVSVDPISLGILRRPGDYGADIVVAEGQALGTPMQFGGPYLGILACRQSYVRKMPGRLVGQTVDRRGKRCWVLTLQTREQHIRREKATSNICTNQGLLALRATIYLAALGPQGLRQTAQLCARKAHYCAQELARLPGVELTFSRPFFKEFCITVAGDVRRHLQRLASAGFHAGVPLDRWYPDLNNVISVAVTEKRTRAEIDSLVRCWREVLTSA
ncbi:MAG: aminomethyl-transferring glycine dehydrogenase [Gemmataceae bacterium]